MLRGRGTVGRVALGDAERGVFTPLCQFLFDNLELLQCVDEDLLFVLETSPPEITLLWRETTQVRVQVNGATIAATTSAL